MKITAFVNIVVNVKEKKWSDPHNKLAMIWEGPSFMNSGIFLIIQIILWVIKLPKVPFLGGLHENSHHSFINTMRKIRWTFLTLDFLLSPHCFITHNSTICKIKHCIYILTYEEEDIFILFQIQSLKLQHQVYNANSGTGLDA